MKLRTALAGIALAAGAVVGVSAPTTTASAMTKTPQVAIPSAPRGYATFALDAPAHAWGIRRVARYWDRHVPAIRVYTTGGCSVHPSAYCITVSVQDYGETRWLAQTFPYPVLNIELNSHWHYRHQAVACHEFGHALGLDHHAGTGCVVSTDAQTALPSPAEMAATQAWYGGAA